MSYHYRIACGHFARALMQGSERRRPHTGAVAVLHLLWSYAPEPTADYAVVQVPAELFAGYAGSDARRRQTLAVLRNLGAAERVEFGYALRKPAIEDLDVIARRQVAAAAAALGVHVDGEPRRKTPAEREAAALARQERQRARQQTRERRQATLTALDKQLSDVRDLLAGLDDMPPSALRYSGRGASAVTAAVDWLADTGATWRAFWDVGKRAYEDADPRRPAKVHELFMSKHSDYLEHITRTMGQDAT